MARYIAGRLLQSAFALWAVVTIVFFLSRLTGNPLDLLIDNYATEADRAALAAHLGLDGPLLLQYGRYMGQVLHGDLGKSLVSGRPAIVDVLERVPATLEIGALGILVTLAVALPVGVYAAVRRGGPFDLAGRSFAILGQSMPVFWLGIILILIFAVHLKLLPAGGRGGIQHVILPAVTLGWFTAAGIMRLTRSSMLEVLDSEYVKLARLKGLPEHVVIWKHAFRNAALPVVTYTAILFVTFYVAGSIVVETVFVWPGVGRLMLESVTARDFPVVQTGVLFISSMYILVNLAVDILYGYLNPRIRYQKD